MKKLISILLVAMLIISMIPATVSAADEGSFVLATDTSWTTGSNRIVIVANVNGALYAMGNTFAKKISKVDVTATGNVLNGTDLPEWTVGQNGSNVSLKDKNGKFLKYGTSGTDFSSGSYGWAVSKSGDAFNFKATTGSNRGILYRKSVSQFGAYSTTNATNADYVYGLYVYVWTENAVTGCEHANTTTVTVPATCTEAGSTTVTCDDCKVVLNTQVISATNHENKELKTEAVAGNCQTEGKTAVYYCPDCGETLGGESTGLGDHNYVDGTCSVCGTELKGYPQVTTIDAITAGGQFVIVAEYNGKYYAMNQNVANTVYVTEVEVADGVVVTSDAPVWTIAGTTGTNITLSDGKDYATINGSNNFTASDTAYDWVLTEQDGEFRITASTNSTRGLAFSWNNGTNPRFKTYSTNNLEGAGYVWYLQLYKVITSAPAVYEDEESNGYATIEEAIQAGATVLKAVDEATEMPFDITVDGKRYIGLEGEDGFYSYYTLELKVSGVALRASEAGIYYYAQAVCDDALAGAVDSYGIVLSANDMPTKDALDAADNAATQTLTTDKALPNGKDDKFNSGSVFNILKDVLAVADNQRRGEAVIYAVVYLEIDGKHVISTQEVKLSLQGVLELINTRLGDNLTLNKEQNNELYNFYQKWAVEKEVINGWNLDKIAALTLMQ